MVAFNMIALHSGVSAASFTTEAPTLAGGPPVQRMLQTASWAEKNHIFTYKFVRCRNVGNHARVGFEACKRKCLWKNGCNAFNWAKYAGHTRGSDCVLRSCPCPVGEPRYQGAKAYKGYVLGRCAGATTTTTTTTTTTGAGKDCTEKDIIAAVVAAEQGDNLFTFPDPACRTGAKCFADCPLQCKNDIKTLTAGKAYCNDGKVEITQPLCDVDAATRKKYGNGVSCMGARFPSCNKCDVDWCDASSPDEECKFENGVCTEKTAVTDDVCRLPGVVGPCRAARRRFFFNALEGKCKQFLYGGCRGNQNNFATQEECETRCPGAYKEDLAGIEVGCPGGWRCFNRNIRYPTLIAAQTACDVTPGCGIINHWKGGGYYLRRNSDPKGKNSRTTNFRKPTQ